MKDEDDPRTREIPKGRFGRLARMGLGGLSTASKLLVGRDAEGAAVKAVELLGTLRGLAAKAGQIASYVDGIVPEEHRALVDRTLGTLRAAAPTSSFEAVKQRLEEELKAPLDQLYARFDPRPFASASIGQVHKAALLDGTEVAVKVQHPGIDKAMESDLANASVIESLVGNMGTRKLGSKQVIEEVRARFREELDYALEADRQEQFARLVAGDPTIRIPHIYRDRSSKRVMTSALHQGHDLEWAAQQPEALRRAYAETLWRFVFTGNLVGGMFNADPHPGNYLFRENGEITFLDFGCVQVLHDVALARVMHRAACAGDEAGFRDGARKLLGTTPGAYEDWALAFSRACFDPLFESPFRATREYTMRLVESMRDMKRNVMFAKNSGFKPLPPGMLFMNRLQFGFYSVLTRLDVAVDYAAIEREILRRVPA